MPASSQFAKLLLLTSSLFAVTFPWVLCSVGTSFFQEFTGGGSGASFNIYDGFLMTNDCALIAENTSTDNENQMCDGGWSNGVSVTCDSNHLGQHWTCSPTDDHSCDVGGSGGRFEVLACCDRV
ncbi:hypothetical protein BDP27DRAFT_1320992 [Rhodocollybia butyracea]|uniref:SRCR domain-containing protein n=1 Tax=Rhodocollybia butyracea TaxID=206335 RepID=A0A9P5UBF6_9AGAR|nr:hypothetical protein BDP27DRAFT_1320992 [Rhodocollybia butyracea]